MVDKPFAILGSHTRADVRFPEGIAPKRAIYLHACSDGLYYVYLEASPPAGRPSEGWLLPTDTLIVGGVRVSANATHVLTSNSTTPRLTEYGSTAPPFPVVKFMRDDRSLGNRRYRSRLNFIGKRVKATQSGASGVLSTFQHVVLWEEEQLWVIDLLSSRGTQIDGDSVDAATLSVGQVADFGNLQLLFRRLSSGQSHDDGQDSSDSGEIQVDFRDGPVADDLAPEASPAPAPVHVPAPVAHVAPLPTPASAPAAEELLLAEEPLATDELWEEDSSVVEDELAADERPADDDVVLEAEPGVEITTANPSSRTNQAREEERFRHLCEDLERQRDELARQRDHLRLELEAERKRSDEQARQTEAQLLVRNDLERECDELARQRDALRLELDDRQKSAEQSNRETESQRLNQAELELQREKLKLEREQFLRQTQILGQARADLEQQREQIEQQRIEYERRHEADEQARGEYERLVAELKQDAQRVLREQETLRRIREELVLQERQAQDARTELARRDEELAAERQAVERERQEWANELAHYSRSQAEQSELSARQAQLEARQAELDAQQESLAKLRAEFKTQQEELEAQRLDLTSRTAEAEARQSDLAAQQAAWLEKMRGWTAEHTVAWNEIREALAVVEERTTAAQCEDEARRLETATLHAALTREKIEFEARRRDWEASAARERAELTAKNSQAQELMAELCARETEILSRECELSRRAALPLDEGSKAADWRREREEWMREREAWMRERDDWERERAKSQEHEQDVVALQAEVSDRFEQLELERASFLDQQRQLEAQLESQLQAQLAAQAEDRLRLESFATELEQRERAMFEREMGFDQAADERRLAAAMIADEKTALAERPSAGSAVAGALVEQSVDVPQIAQTVDWAGEMTVEGPAPRDARLSKATVEEGDEGLTVDPRSESTSPTAAADEQASPDPSDEGHSHTSPALGRRARADRDQMGAIVTDRLILREASGRYWLRGLWVVAGTVLISAALAVGYILLASR